MMRFTRLNRYAYEAGVLTITAMLAPAVLAQVEISSPVVHEASVPKSSISTDTKSLMSAAPMQVWSEGQPVKVKQDLKGHDDLSQPEYLPKKQRDPLLAPSRVMLRSTSPAAAVAAPTPTIGANFDGIGATGVLPPDTIGAVGPNHYIQMVNSAFAIYDKTGNLLAGPSQINSLWQDFGGGCETDNDGDPVVRYDHLADRWLVSQFAINKSLQCIAISKGADPVTSGWYLYAFDTKDANNNPVTPDYPKIGVWPDGYYMSTQRGFPNSGLDVWVFERDRMLAGQPARQVQFSIETPSIVFQPSDLDGPPPPVGTPNFFMRQVDGERFTGQDRLEVYAFSVNWTNPAASTFEHLTDLSTAAFDSVLCSATLMGTCVPQPGTSARLETLSVWPMFRAQYRNFGSHETLLLNHSVDATGQDIAGVRWYELRRPPNGTWSIFQQGTHAPDNVNRWMGSLAMDDNGDILVGYSVADGQTFPGIRVAHRYQGDPAGALRAETNIVNGGGSQTYASAPRWGDYGSMDVDPSQPRTFWYTTLYYASTSSAGWSTRISEVRLPQESVPVAYEHNAYTGRSQVLTAGRHDLDQLSIGNDVISSVKVPTGWKVTLYRDHHFQGDTKVLTTDANALPDFNDMTSSIVVEAVPVAYEHNAYTGRSQVLTAGRHDLDQLSIGNDVISSVKVPTGWKVTLYRDHHFQGATKVLTANTPVLPDFNDMTSSIVVENLHVTVPYVREIAPGDAAKLLENAGLVPEITGSTCSKSLFTIC